MPSAIMIRKPSGIENKSRFQLMQPFRGRPSLAKSSGFLVQPGTGKRSEEILYYLPTKHQGKHIRRNNSQPECDDVAVNHNAKTREQASNNCSLGTGSEPRPDRCIACDDDYAEDESNNHGYHNEGRSRQRETTLLKELAHLFGEHLIVQQILTDV